MAACSSVVAGYGVIAGGRGSDAFSAACSRSAAVFVGYGAIAGRRLAAFSSPSSGSSIVCSTNSTSQVSKAAVSSSSKPMTIHVGETSITLPMSVENAKALCSTMEGLIQTLGDKTKLEGSSSKSPPRRLKNVEYLLSADAIDSEGVSFELFCNPNAFANAFQAKVLISVTNGKISITAEGELSVIKADVDQFLGQ